MTGILPTESESAEIGHRAVAAFHAQKPDGWRPSDLSGDADAGYDSFVQVVAHAQYMEAFHAQFKGSTVSAYSADRSFVSVPLRVATVNYYKRVGIPIMLVFVDLSDDAKKRSECPIFYDWIHDKLDEALDRAPSDATLSSELTFRVPTANRLDEKLDVTPFLAAEREKRQRARMLTDAIAGTASAPPTVLAVEQLATNITMRGASFLESALGQTETPWASPEPGTTAWHLKQLEARISAGASDEAQELLARLDYSTLRDTTEQAEYHLLQGRLHRLVGSQAESSASFAEANRLASDRARYRAAWLEDRFIQAIKGNGAVTDVLAEIDRPGQTPAAEIRALRARVLDAIGQSDEAMAEIDQVPPERAAVEKTIILLSSGRFDEAMAYASEAQHFNINRYTVLTLRILGARAHFDSVFHLAAGKVCPLGGPPGLDVSELSPLWQELRALAHDLQRAGWPLNSEYIADAISAVSISTGRAAEALPFIDSLLRAHPFDESLRLLAVKVGVFAGQFSIALEAAEGLKNESVRTIHQVLIHYQATAFQRCIALTPKLLALPFDCDELLPEALAVAAHSAHRLFNLDFKERCLKRLEEGKFHNQIAIVHGVCTEADGGATNSAARQALIDAYRKSPDSEILQDHAIGAFRHAEVAEATELVDVVAKIRRRRQLSPPEYVLWSKALGTLERPEDAIDVLERARAQYLDDEKLKASEALLCERYGHTKRARDLLKELLDSKEHSDFARSLYIDIAARSGLLDEAYAQFQSLLGDADTPAAKKGALKGLIALEFYRATPSSSLPSFIREFGRLVDRNLEEEEGLFLQMIVSVGLRVSMEPSPAEIAEFNQRVEAFVTRFPRSAYFSAIRMPVGASPEEVVRTIDAELASRFPRDEGLENIRRQAQRGSVSVPFVWRPRFLIPNVDTVSQLWEIAKKAPGVNPVLAFDINHGSRPAKDLRTENRIPLIDQLSLLVITDLELWPILLRIFDRVAISKRTLYQIQNDGGPLGAPSTTLSMLRKAIRDNLDHIEQPGDAKESPSEPLSGLDDLKGLLATGPYSLYCDDAAARVYLLGQKEPEAIHTGRLLRTAENIGRLAAHDVARMLAQLVRWHVGGVLIDDRHILMCLPERLFQEPSLKAKIKALFETPDYQSLISGLWDPPKSIRDTTQHVSRLLAFLLRYNPDMDDKVVAAIWASWLDKVKIRQDFASSVEEQLAVVLILTCWELRESDSAARKLWGAYIHLIDRQHGDRMDEKLERQSREIVGKVLASGVGQVSNLPKIDEAVTAVGKGLTKDTTPYDHFIHRYEAQRIAQGIAQRETKG